MNDMCHVLSLEKDFYLGALGSFDHDFTLLATLNVFAMFYKGMISTNFDLSPRRDFRFPSITKVQALKGPTIS
jgi:hypothetical protein